MVLAHSLEIFLRHEVRARAVETFGHFFEAVPAVEFLDGGDDGVAFGFRAGVLDGFPERFVWNINCRFHASKIT
jgi:hypothetical protein